jgi:NAD(P)-dependent dehydrogenase (short-subunit alcohol dehydrogenase family)
MYNKKAIVTGANKGIGFEIARQLGLKGFHVFLAVRNAARGEEALARLGIPSAEVVVMDVSSGDSIRSAFELISSKTDRIDVLVNNAGILMPNDNDIMDASTMLVLSTVQTNALGPLRVVQTFLPLLSQGSRVINISSSSGHMTDGKVSTWSPVYCLSKTLLNAITLQLSAALAERGVVVNAVCPGRVETDMKGRGVCRTVEVGADTPVWLATEAPLQVNGQFLRDRQQLNW